MRISDWSSDVCSSDLIGATVELTPAWRYTLVAAPLLWLASKELLRAFYYQRAGAVRERLSDRQRRGHFWMVAYLAAMALLIIGGLAWSAGARTWQWPGIAYVAIVDRKSTRLNSSH